MSTKTPAIDEKKCFSGKLERAPIQDRMNEVVLS